MEHFESPFGPADISSEQAIENAQFLKDLLEKAKQHPYFSHPFLCSLEGVPLSRDLVAFILTSVYKLVSPFTALLCSLGGQAPTLQSRFALMDNIYEEMGCGKFEAAHPNLYLKMLSSIGVSEEAAERAPTFPSIRRINEQLREAVERRPFAVGCAMLAVAEAVIPPTFPVLSAMARAAFPEVDMTFFDRHGPRDEGHSDDAVTLFAVTAERAHFGIVETEVNLALDYRTELFDDWMMAVMADRAPARPRAQRARPAAPRAHVFAEPARPREERPRPAERARASSDRTRTSAERARDRRAARPVKSKTVPPAQG